MATATVEVPAALENSLAWPQYPRIYEINTWVWLSELSQKYGKRLDLSSIPASEWDALGQFGFDAVWLMGVWERSSAGVAISNGNGALLEDFRRALPDFRPDDNVGSPYCVRQYVVDGHFGGPQALAVARRELSNRGLKLILDFVPNHVAPDHPWVTEHPEYFIQGNVADITNSPAAYITVGGRVFACGRDPYFPAWPDVLQLNAFDGTLRRAIIDTISGIAQQCDGIRCDMAMLVMNAVFERTWAQRAGQRPTSDYWVDIIHSIKSRYSTFLFIAEAYWDLEWELQQQGFDYCYDKKLYDRLEHSDAESIRLHLCADLHYQRQLVRFIENHDEPRAAMAFSIRKEEAVALSVATIPGATLFHEGQFEGRKVRLPVFLGRRPAETPDAELKAFYAKLLNATTQPAFHNGRWALCNRTGWPDNSSFYNLVAWSWVWEDEHYLIILNLSNTYAQSRVQVDWEDVADATWCLVDLISGTMYMRNGNEMASPGLYVELGPWDYHFFHCLRGAA